MAETFLCVRTGPFGFEQRVCVKRILPSYGDDAELLRLFAREARLGATLSHRNITRVLELGEERGCPYLVLELVDGVDLRRLVNALPAPRRIDPSVVTLLASELASALEHAHTRGGATGPIVHRDLSPANVLVSAEGEVKLSDFGICTALAEDPTRSGLVRGNVWYMAPEQLEPRQRADPRSDLFALGVVLYQCLSGRRPYEGSNEISAMRALLEQRRAPLAKHASDAPRVLIDIVERLLAHSPDERFQSAAELADALPSIAERNARRALARLVREHRQTQAPPRVPTLSIAALEAFGKGPTEPARPAPLARRKSWHAYQRGPGMWDSAPVAVRKAGLPPISAVGRR